MNKYRLKEKGGDYYLNNWNQGEHHFTYDSFSKSDAIILNENEARDCQDYFKRLGIELILEIAGEDEEEKYREIDKEAERKFIEMITNIGFKVVTNVQNKTTSDLNLTPHVLYYIEPRIKTYISLAGEYVGEITDTEALTGNRKDSGRTFDVYKGIASRGCLVRDINKEKFLELVRWKGLTKKTIEEKLDKFKRHTESLNKFLNIIKEINK